MTTASEWPAMAVITMVVIGMLFLTAHQAWRIGKLRGKLEVIRRLAVTITEHKRALQEVSTTNDMLCDFERNNQMIIDELNRE